MTCKQIFDYRSNKRVWQVVAQGRVFIAGTCTAALEMAIAEKTND